MYIKNLTIHDNETLTFETNYGNFQFYPKKLPNGKDFPAFLIIGLIICFFIGGFFLTVFIVIHTQKLLLPALLFLLINSLPFLYIKRLIERPIYMTLKYHKNQNLLVYLSDDTPLYVLYKPKSVRFIIRMFYMTVRSRGRGLYYRLFPTVCLEVVGENKYGKPDFLRITEDILGDIVSTRLAFYQPLNDYMPILEFLDLDLSMDKDSVYWENSTKSRDWAVYDTRWVKDLNKIKPRN